MVLSRVSAFPDEHASGSSGTFIFLYRRSELMTADRARQTNTRSGGRDGGLDDLTSQLNQMLSRSARTEERLAKLERLRILEGKRQGTEQSGQTQNVAPGLSEPSARSRPPASDFRISRQKGRARAKNVTVEQIYESLQALRDEVYELTANHDQMVGQINVIKRLIH
jgi:hypothetical protein